MPAASGISSRVVDSECSGRQATTKEPNISGARQELQKFMNSRNPFFSHLLAQPRIFALVLRVDFERGRAFLSERAHSQAQRGYRLERLCSPAPRRTSAASKACRKHHREQ